MSQKKNVIRDCFSPKSPNFLDYTGGGEGVNDLISCGKIENIRVFYVRVTLWFSSNLHVSETVAAVWFVPF